MSTLALAVTLWLAVANEVDASAPPPAEEVVVEPGPEPWAGEHRRVHAGVGARVHGGLVDSNGFPLWALQSEIFGTLNIRLRGHDELRVQLGLSGGWPDSMGGETNVSFHHSFNPRVSLGIGGFVYLGVWSLRAGVEVPLIIRSTSRRHQLIIGVRLQTGVFNNVAITGWKLTNQRFALAGGVALGYAFQF